MSSFVDSTSGAVEHCETMAKLYPDLAPKYQEMSKLTTDKLWHQLTLVVLDFVSTQTARTTAEGTNSHLALYDKVVLASDKKLNQLSLARIASAVASSMVHNDASDDKTAAKAILENLLEKKTQLGPAATLYVESKLGLLTLGLLEEGGGEDKDALASIKDMLKSNAAVLQEMPVVNDMAMVHSAHYECAMTYRKAVGPPEAYYKEALAFLNYTPVESISKEDRFQLATDLSLAALTGEGVFNFGEVVTTPILQELENTNMSWLVELMHASAKGDVLEFSAILERNASAIQQQPALMNRATFCKEKITLLALVNMCFERPSSERTVTFDQVAERIHMPKDQVELVVMRALSLGLIKGSMDQVDETLQVTWVMPRVLQKPQLQELSERFGDWAVKVSKTRDYMEQQTPMLA